MSGSLRWRILLTLVVAIATAAFVLPSFVNVKGSPLAKILPDRNVNLGLDLKGGMHLTLGVDLQKALSNSVAQMGQDIKVFAREEKIAVLAPKLIEGDRLQFVLVKPEQKEDMDKLLSKRFDSLVVESTRAGDEGRIIYTLEIKPEYRKYVSDMTVDQAVKTIRSRIDQFGVAEPDIRKQQDGRIQVQLPGLHDTERAKAIIGKTAHLEFKIVDETADIRAAVNGLVPPGSELLDMTYTRGNVDHEEKIVVKKEAVLTGEYIADAKTGFDSYNKPYVSVTFNSRGAWLFEQITGENTKKRMAIVLDGKVYSAPVIQEKIAGGQASITGSFSVEEARDLALILRAGALPAPVNILEERNVGPSLGQESIDAGMLAGLVSAAAIMIFMAVYYGIPGVFANIVLFLNMGIIVAGLAGFGATLTLPGIAGIILTMAVAVDGNVLIYERIREELRLGLTPRAALDAGYSRATVTILDTNVTNIIAAIVLYEFGTGPIRGFAVTFILGILASMFTAIFVSRVLFDLWMQTRPQDAKLNI